MVITLLQQLNAEIGSVIEDASRSLMQVRSGPRAGGAGSIWHPDGLIVTNAHVIKDRPIHVVLPDGTAKPVRLLAQDAERDVAALAVDASGLPALRLGDSRTVQPGQWVMALGHPWGVAAAASGGVVIGAGSDLPEMPNNGQEWIAVSLQLRPGHSGGPLLDAQGHLIGINTMMMGLAVGIAAPVHGVKAFLKENLGAATM